MKSDALRRLAAMHLQPEQMSEVLTMFADQEAAEEARKAAQRERTRKSRELRSERDRNITVTPLHSDKDVTPPSPFSLDKEKSPTPPKETKPNTPLPPETSAFEDFWALFPNKTGKADARQKFQIASRKVSRAELMEGLQRYVSKTDDRPWCNPGTWLHQERWADEPPKPVARASPPSSQVPSMSEMFRVIGDRVNADQPGPPEDRSGFRAAIPHLRTVGTG